MRILIADDELLERKAMRKFIQDNFKDMEVVGEAENGRRAIELALEKRPHIIFMDIKMPGVNGLEAIEQIHLQLPAVKFILVTAYDTFAYAKQAMQYGIKDYILKPEKKEEIVKALFRLQKEIGVEEKMELEKHQSQQLLGERLIRGLIKQPFQAHLLTLQQQLFPQMVSGYFLVMGGHELDLLADIKAQLNRVEAYDFLFYEKEDILIIMVMVNTRETKANQLVFARKLSLEYEEALFIGIGRIEEKVESMYASYRSAYAAYFQLMTEGKTKYGFLQERDQADINDHSKEIIKAVEKGKQEDALEKFKEVELSLTNSAKENLYISIQTLFSVRGIYPHESTIFKTQSSEEWTTYLNMCCMRMKDYWHSKESMSQAVSYIEENFAKAITLEEVAKVVNLSPNYFSNLFKEEAGETFIEFLTKTRMTHAKLLIEQNCYSLKEICYKVGYKDPNYFSRVFKKYFDMSPKHFLNSIFKK